MANTNNKPTALQAKIIDTAQHHPNLSTREIGAIAGTDHAYVIRTLERYGIDKETTERFKTNRADIFAGVQEKFISSITVEDLQKASLYQKVTAAAILYDKERLERGQASEIVDHRHLQVDLAQALRAMREGADTTIDAEVIEPDMGTSLGVSE